MLYGAEKHRLPFGDIMSIFDAFKPKWQNSNPEKRIEAIDELNSQHQDILENIALRDEDKDVRLAAIKKLTIVSTLLNISKNDTEAMEKVNKAIDQFMK